MRHVRALATDYDETLAEIGFVPDRHLRAMERFRASGRTLILNTGRGWEDLLAVFPEIERFDALVLENGTLLVDPKTRKQRLLAKPLPPAFLADLRRRGVSPLPQRQIIVDTWAVHVPQIREAIHQAGLNLDLIFNQDTVMILPAGMDKGTGLRELLTGTGIALNDVAAIGDGENDLGLLAACGVKVAVPNAVPQLLAKADHVLTFEQLVDAILIQ